MSDNKNSKKTDSQQTNTQPSHYEQSRGYAKTGSIKVLEVLQSSTPQTTGGAAIKIGQAALAGAKDYVKSTYHAGMGFMQGARQQFPNDGQQLNNMIINKAIKEGRARADQKNSVSSDKSTNKGIASFQDKVKSQSSNVSKSNSNSTTKSSSVGSSKSGGSSSGGGKSGGSSSSGCSSGGQSR